MVDRQEGKDSLTAIARGRANWGGSGGRLNQQKPVQDIFVRGIKGSLNSAKARRALLKGPNGKIAYKSEYAPLVKNRQ